MKPEKNLKGFAYLALFLTVFLLTLAGTGHCQTSVVLSPYPQLQFFDQSGKALAFGCVFSYQSQTSTPLATYTDFTGTIPNANPVVLTAGGSANIWLQAGAAYTLIVKSTGGTNCSLGTTQYSVNGIGGGSTQNVTPVTPVAGVATFNASAQNQLFTVTLTANTISNALTTAGVVAPAFITFQITQDGVGGHTFSWPANVIGGATVGSVANQVSTQSFIWTGTSAYAIGPGMEGTGPIVAVGSLILDTSITSPAFISASANPSLTGIFRMASGNAIGWRNNANNADVLLSKDASDNLVWPNGLKLGGAAALASTAQSGTGSLCMTTSCAMTTPAIAGPTLTAPSSDSWKCGITSKTANYTLTITDCIVQASASGGGFTLTLNHLLTGQTWWITRTDSTVANSLTIAGDSGNVNGAANIKVPVNSSAVCHPDGTNSWCTVSTIQGQVFVQAGVVTGCGATCTFTYPVAYSSILSCTCTGEGGSCNVASKTATTCTINATVGTNDFIVAGTP